MGKMSRIGHDLYDGSKSIDFVGKRWVWYIGSAVILTVALLGLFAKGLNWGIEFEGGVEYRIVVPADRANQDTADEVRTAITDAARENGIAAARNPIVNTSDAAIRAQVEAMSREDQATIREAIEVAVDPTEISEQSIGPSWGEEVADRAIQGLIVFLVLVIIMIWAYFRQWKMAVAAMVALAHDVVITVGIYALSGFEVTPATVTGVLTILGFSLYDTVVVFDQVRDNTKPAKLAHSRLTYAQAANLAVNQTLVRSINTSIVALIPVGALLYVGAFLLGAGALKDLSLSLFVGMAVGLFSSVFIATPLFVHLKESEPGVKKGDARAMRQKRVGVVDPYAHVPTDEIRIGSPSSPADDSLVEFDEFEVEVMEPEPASTQRRTPTGPVTPAEPRPSSRPVADSASAHRPQPTRKPRSRRGKK